MTYQLKEIFPGGSVASIALAETIDEALAKVPGKIIACEEDPAAPDCWDVMSANRSAARQFTIEWLCP